MNRKAIPHIVTGMRFIFTVLLLFPPVPGTAFAVFYLGAGLTDVLDGWLARRLHAESILGARLDSAADFFFFAVMLFRLYPAVKPGTAVLLWVAGIALLRLAAAGAAKYRFGKFGFLHTYANKLTGLLLFCYPLSLFLTQSPAVISVLCAAATLSAAEELLMELTSKRWEPDRSGIFAKPGRAGGEKYR
jgi:phosphatidylglycerophosphate synthase